MKITDKRLRQLSEIDACGSVRKAAEELNVTQSALSKSIIEFEKDLGFDLLIRSSAGVSLTNSAMEIVRRGRSILMDLACLERDLNQWPSAASGMVRIGAGPGSVYPLVEDVISDFLEKFPNVEVSIYNRAPHELASMLESDQIDVLISIDETLKQDSELVRRPIRREKVNLFTSSKSDVPSSGMPIGRIEGVRMCAPFTTQSFINWLEKRCREGGIALPKFFICNDYHLICREIEKKGYIGICTDQMFDYLSKYHEISKFHIDEFDMEVVVNCIYRRSNSMGRSVKYLIKMIEDGLGNL